ncbi:hypothetical protein H7X46_19180 [Pseudonocardia sp. C8]|uniref:hypothetical protein n=1 Tax=Pseudonocardia sp. C8 TaxID=2762759 RepID=UPI001642E347|nr:hypothetical protein [Pseudonocardia sp. C8]MBC3193186.1 hypothetical protein [Pseudonocardia sp. C8]
MNTDTIDPHTFSSTVSTDGTGTIAAPAPDTGDDPAARSCTEAIRRLTAEHAPRIAAGQLTARDIAAAVECSWDDLRRAGAPPACLAEFLERLARVRLAELASSS